jgi:hypothetical protein
MIFSPGGGLLGKRWFNNIEMGRATPAPRNIKKKKNIHLGPSIGSVFSNKYIRPPMPTANRININGKYARGRGVLSIICLLLLYYNLDPLHLSALIKMKMLKLAKTLDNQFVR